MITIAYPYKRKVNDFSIIHSIQVFRKYYPNCRIVTIGDSCGIEDVNTPYNEPHLHRGSNVTDKLLAIAETCDRFIFMNDDFFINDRFDFDIVHGSFENLERKEGKASIEWNTAVDNSRNWLTYNGFDTVSYECHQPCVINSKKFINLFKEIDWRNHQHFIKSIYFNVYTPEKFRPMDNCKLIEFNEDKANLFLTVFGCLSISESFLTDQGCAFIKKLL